MAQSCKPETRCKDPTKSLSGGECNDPEDQTLVTNPECTDAHQGSNPNRVNECDSNMIPDAVEGARLNTEEGVSDEYLKMRAYSRAQNCQYVGEASLTQGVKGGYNAAALMIADPRQAKDGRGLPMRDTPTFSYPGTKDTAASTASGYATEADQYMQTKTSGDDNLRQPDLQNFSELIANKNNTRVEVSRASKINDPLCGPLVDRSAFDCSQSCLAASRSQCMLLSAQCAYTEGLTCTKGIKPIVKCFKRVCKDDAMKYSEGQCDEDFREVEVDCTADADDVLRVVPTDSIEACAPGKTCGTCVEYEPVMIDGKQAIEGAEKYVRETVKTCFDRKGDKIACTLDGTVARESIVPKTTETCYAEDGSKTSCGIGGGAYADDVHRVVVDDGNPFFLTEKVRFGDIFQEKQIDRTNIKSGKCDFETRTVDDRVQLLLEEEEYGPSGQLLRGEDQRFESLRVDCQQRKHPRRRGPR